MNWREQVEALAYRILATCSVKGWPMNRTRARQIAAAAVADEAAWRARDSANRIKIKLPSRFCPPTVVAPGEKLGQDAPHGDD
jgi:hypothetical protein